MPGGRVCKRRLPTDRVASHDRKVRQNKCVTHVTNKGRAASYTLGEPLALTRYSYALNKQGTVGDEAGVGQGAAAVLL